jgi:hypothetical protein
MERWELIVFVVLVIVAAGGGTLLVMLAVETLPKVRNGSSVEAIARQDGAAQARRSAIERRAA